MVEHRGLTAVVSGEKLNIYAADGNVLVRTEDISHLKGTTLTRKEYCQYIDKFLDEKEQSEYSVEGDFLEEDDMRKFFKIKIKPPANGRYWVEFYNPNGNIGDRYQTAQREYHNGEWINPTYGIGYVLTGWYSNKETVAIANKLLEDKLRVLKALSEECLSLKEISNNGCTGNIFSDFWSQLESVSNGLDTMQFKKLI